MRTGKARLLLGGLVNTVPNRSELDKFVTATLPPITFTPGGAVIDFSILLFAEELAFDKTSAEYLLNHPFDNLKKIGSSIELLRKEGFLKLVDFLEIAKARKQEIEGATELAGEMPEIWLDGVRAHIRKYLDVQQALRTTLGVHMSPWDNETFSIGNYLAQKNGYVNPRAAKRLSNLIMRKSMSEMSRWELEAVTRVVQETMRGVISQAVVADEVESYPFCWKTYDHIFGVLDRLSPHGAMYADANLQAAQALFTVAFPEFAPQTTADWLRLLTHKNVDALRRRIFESVQDGEPLDRDFAVRELSKLTTADRRIVGRKTWIGRGLGGAGLAAGVGATLASVGASPLEAVAAAVATGGAPLAAQEFINRLINRRQGSQRWMYFTTVLAKDKSE